MDQTVVSEQRDRDRKEIVSAYQSLMRACMDSTDKAERKEIRRAFEYAVEAHEGAKRKSGEPYILHPIAVARIVAKEMGLDAVSIVCALLHDVVEDTFREIEDIRAEFGSEVASIIDGLTKISGVFDHKSSEQAENFRKMLLTLSDDVRVILIKLADRLHNMRTLEHMKKEGQLKISSETLYLYAPLANRLGLHAVKVELEDLALKYTEPATYLQIASKLEKFKLESRSYVHGFMHSIREKLRNAGFDFRIKERYKSIYSIYAKMIRQEVDFESVFDLFAIRIILRSQPNIEKMEIWRAYAAITELYTPNQDRLRDWITVPKTNGYESLHVTVMGPKGRWIEVQIRSERMDDSAERGLAAHWKYKDGTTQYDDRFINWLGRIRELLENPHMNAVEIVKEFKTNLVADELFAFTPKGNLVRLPHRSTVLDFAYEIHTNIGDQCIGAKVNNKVVPLSHPVHNGDQVEIITSKKQQPKEEWLNYVVSHKAQHKIKEAVRRQKKEIAEKGKQIFEWKMRNYAFDKGEIIKELLAFFLIPNDLEFFYLLGMHKIDMTRLMEYVKIKEEGGKIQMPVEEAGRNRLQTKKDLDEWLKQNKGGDSDMLVIGEDMNIVDYKIAHCCEPVPGDSVVAFFHPDDKDVVIHRTGCPKAITLLSHWGRNVVKAKWTQNTGISYLAGVKIVGQDRQGMMNALIKVISNQLKINIRSITIDSNNGMFEGVFKIFVHSAEELDKAKKRLQEVNGVLTVTRIGEK